MKTTLLLSLAFTIALSINSVAGLKCLTCALDCTSPRSTACGSGLRYCYGATIKTTITTPTISTPTTPASPTLAITQKGCASLDLCPSGGLHTVSLNLGISNVLASLNCCNTDDCNVAAAPNLPSLTAGNLKCVSCDSTTSTCSKEVSCNEQERCFFTKTKDGEKNPTRGCASTNLCGAAAAPILAEIKADTLGTFHAAECCDTAKCNSASSVSSLLLLQVLALVLALIF